MNGSLSLSVCVCVCACAYERDREGQRDRGGETWREGDLVNTWRCTQTVFIIRSPGS